MLVTRIVETAMSRTRAQLQHKQGRQRWSHIHNFYCLTKCDEQKILDSFYRVNLKRYATSIIKTRNRRTCHSVKMVKYYRLVLLLFKLDIRKKFFTMRMVKHWNGLPGEAVEASSLETFKTRLDGALSNLV